MNPLFLIRFTRFDHLVKNEQDAMSDSDCCTLTSSPLLEPTILLLGVEIASCCKVKREKRRSKKKGFACQNDGQRKHLYTCSVMEWGARGQQGQRNWCQSCGDFVAPTGELSPGGDKSKMPVVPVPFPASMPIRRKKTRKTEQLSLLLRNGLGKVTPF